MAIPLPGFISKDDVTGSIKQFSSPLSSQIGLEDWRRAVMALAVALDPKGSGETVAWSNPKSGLKGKFTPVGEAYRREERVCRAFLGEIGEDESVRGTGCVDRHGDWAVLDVKPLKRG
jgi:surface antigen